MAELDPTPAAADTDSDPALAERPYDVMSRSWTNC